MTTKEILTVTNTVDLQIAMRIVRVLMTPYTELDAYKLGIIDGAGNTKKQTFELKSGREKEAYSPLMKLLIRIKQIFDKYNVKRAQAQPFVTLAGALKYIRENETLVGFENYMNKVEVSQEDVDFVKTICEDIGTGIASVASIPPTANAPVVPKVKNKYKERNSKNSSTIVRRLDN